MAEEKLLATRAGYGQGLLDIGEKYDDVIVLEGDLGGATGSAAFRKAYPDRYIEAGIAEQNEVGMAAGLAAVKATDKEKEELKKATEEYRHAVESGNIEDIIRWDEAFHKKIVSCSGNKTLVQLVSQVQELALRFRYIYYDDFSRFEGQPQEHKEIVDAIASGDAEKARKAADEHISRLKEFVITEGESVFHGNHINHGKNPQ